MNDNNIPNTPQRPKTLDEIEQEELKGAVLLTDEEYAALQREKLEKQWAEQSKTEFESAIVKEATPTTPKAPSPHHFTDLQSDAEIRPELSLKAFRRYEDFIALAMSKYQTEICPLPLKLSNRTFISRMRDAILGYQRHRHPSSKLTQDMLFKSLKYIPLTNGNVRILNLSRVPSEADTITGQAFNTLLVTTQHKIIEEVCAGMEAKLPRYMDDFFLRFTSPAEEQWILQLESRFSVSVKLKDIRTYHLHP